MKYTNKLLSSFILAFALSACGGASKPNKTTTAQGEARIALFKQCMELAAKMPRQADDDVSDIVRACSGQAYDMTNYLE
jgi:Tfp pilus assembly protein PilF